MLIQLLLPAGGAAHAEATLRSPIRCWPNSTDVWLSQALPRRPTNNGLRSWIDARLRSERRYRIEVFAIRKA